MQSFVIASEQGKTVIQNVHFVFDSSTTVTISCIFLNSCKLLYFDVQNVTLTNVSMSNSELTVYGVLLLILSGG